MDEKFVDDLFESKCYVCNKPYMADFSDRTCGDVVCQTIFAQQMDLRSVSPRPKKRSMTHFLIGMRPQWGYSR